MKLPKFLTGQLVLWNNKKAFFITGLDVNEDTGTVVYTDGERWFPEYQLTAI